MVIMIMVARCSCTNDSDDRMVMTVLDAGGGMVGGWEVIYVFDMYQLNLRNSLFIMTEST